MSSTVYFGLFFAYFLFAFAISEQPSLVCLRFTDNSPGVFSHQLPHSPGVETFVIPSCDNMINIDRDHRVEDNHRNDITETDSNRLSYSSLFLHDCRIQCMNTTCGLSPSLCQHLSSLNLLGQECLQHEKPKPVSRRHYRKRWRKRGRHAGRSHIKVIIGNRQKLDWRSAHRNSL